MAGPRASTKRWEHSTSLPTGRVENVTLPCPEGQRVESTEMVEECETRSIFQANSNLCSLYPTVYTTKLNYQHR